MEELCLIVDRVELVKREETQTLWMEVFVLWELHL